MSLADSLSQAGEMNEPAARNGAVCGVEVRFESGRPVKYPQPGGTMQAVLVNCS